MKLKVDDKVVCNIGLCKDVDEFILSIQEIGKLLGQQLGLFLTFYTNGEEFEKSVERILKDITPDIVEIAKERSDCVKEDASQNMTKWKPKGKLKLSAETICGKRWDELTSEVKKQCEPMFDKLPDFLTKEEVIISLTKDGIYYLSYSPKK